MKSLYLLCNCKYRFRQRARQIRSLFRILLLILLPFLNVAFLWYNLYTHFIGHTMIRNYITKPPCDMPLEEFNQLNSKCGNLLRELSCIREISLSHYVHPDLRFHLEEASKNLHKILNDTRRLLKIQQNSRSICMQKFKENAVLPKVQFQYDFYRFWSYFSCGLMGVLILLIWKEWNFITRTDDRGAKLVSGSVLYLLIIFFTHWGSLNFSSDSLEYAMNYEPGEPFMLC